MAVLDELLEWAKRQHVSTLLLFGILWVVWDMSPRVIEEIEQGYEHNAQILSQVAQAMAQSTEANRQQEERMHNDFRAFLEETRGIHREQLRKLDEILKRLPEQ